MSKTPKHDAAIHCANVSITLQGMILTMIFTSLFWMALATADEHYRMEDLRQQEARNVQP